MATTQNHHYQINFIQLHFHKLRNNNDASNYQSFNQQGLILLICSISILILLPTFFLCIHFCCRLHRVFLLFSQQQQPANPVVVIINPTHDDYHSSSIITKSLSFVGDYENKECCICLSSFQENEKVKILSECEHVYHSECLDLWLRAHPSCPLCRASLHFSNSLAMKKCTI
ncbi:hypothetical protein HN51_061323 [Arachis hypogaea]|nr:RING-H2 finger protein [Arachis hypogaea]